MILREDLDLLSGPLAFDYTRWRKDRLKVSSELSQDRRDWDASGSDVVNSNGDAGSTHPG